MKHYTLRCWGGPLDGAEVCVDVHAYSQDIHDNLQVEDIIWPVKLPNQHPLVEAGYHPGGYFKDSLPSGVAIWRWTENVESDVD